MCLLITDPLIALRGADPESIVVGEDHAVMRTVTDGVSAANRIGRRIQNSEKAGKEPAGGLVLLAGNVQSIAVEYGVGGPVGDCDITLRNQGDAACSFAAGVNRRSGDRNCGQAGGRAAALRTAVDDVGGRAIGREHRLDGVIEGSGGPGADGKDAPRGQLLRLAILGAQVIWIVRGSRLLCIRELHDAVNGEALRGGNVNRLAGGLSRILDKDESLSLIHI